MPAENKAIIQVVGDSGNPSGTGLAKIVLANIWPGVDTNITAKAPDMTTFHAALVTAQLTSTVVGDKALTSKMPFAATKPGVSCNVDRQLLVEWRTKTDSTPHSFTVPGVPKTSTNLELVDNGERLTEAGKAVVATAIEAVFSLSENSVVVKSGIVLQKR